MHLRLDPRHVLLALTALALWLALLVVRPFAGVLFTAAVFATVLSPFTGALGRRLGGHRGGAAVLVTLGLLLAVAGPLAAIATTVLGQATDHIRRRPVRIPIHPHVQRSLASE